MRLRALDAVASALFEAEFSLVIQIVLAAFIVCVHEAPLGCEINGIS